MFTILKKTAKYGLVTAIVLTLTGVAAVAIAGESRTRAVVHEVHGRVLESIDKSIEDPSAMRSQLRDMEREYPKRIAQVRGDLVELQHEIRELEREKAISDRVVELVAADLQEVETQLAGSFGTGEGLRPVSTASWNDRQQPGNRAELRANQLRQQRMLYESRGADAAHDLGYLHHQESRLEQLLVKLETERAEFQTQIAGLSRQIDAIARNDRLIDLLDKRNRTIEECSRYEAASLDQITGRLSMIRSRQEAELDLLASAEAATDYEHAARMQLSAEEPPDALPGHLDDFQSLTARGR